MRARIEIAGGIEAQTLASTAREVCVRMPLHKEWEELLMAFQSRRPNPRIPVSLYVLFRFCSFDANLTLFHYLLSLHDKLKLAVPQRCNRRLPHIVTHSEK